MRSLKERESDRERERERERERIAHWNARCAPQLKMKLWFPIVIEKEEGAG